MVLCLAFVLAHSIACVHVRIWLHFKAFGTVLGHVWPLFLVGIIVSNMLLILPLKCSLVPKRMSCFEAMIFACLGLVS